MPVPKLKVMAKLYWKLVWKIINTEDSILACVLLPNARIIILKQPYNFTQHKIIEQLLKLHTAKCVWIHIGILKGIRTWFVYLNHRSCFLLSSVWRGKAAARDLSHSLTQGDFFARTAISRNILPNELRPWKKSN